MMKNNSKWNREIKKSTLHEIVSFIQNSQINELYKVKNKRLFKVVLNRIKYFDSIEIDYDLEVLGQNYSDNLDNLSKMLINRFNKLTEKLELKYLLSSKFFRNIRELFITDLNDNPFNTIFFKILICNKWKNLKTLHFPKMHFYDENEMISLFEYYERNEIKTILENNIIPNFSNLENLKISK